MPPVLCCALVLSAFVAASAGPERPTYDTFIVPAGTVLTLEVQARLSSSTSRVGEQVTGRLTQAISREDVELVPAGTKVLGSIVEVHPHAGPRPGRLAVRFHVVEHKITGSRAAIRTTPIAVEGERQKARRFGMPVTRGAEASIEAQSIVACILEAPLRVMIPRR